MALLYCSHFLGCSVVLHGGTPSSEVAYQFNKFCILTHWSQYIIYICYCMVSFEWFQMLHVHTSPSLPCTVSHCRGLVCLTCWPSARVSEPLSCTSTKVQSPSLPSSAVWREYATVHPLRVCQSAVWMQVSGVQHWVSCCVGTVLCTSPIASVCQECVS